MLLAMFFFFWIDMLLAMLGSWIFCSDFVMSFFLTIFQ